MSIFSDIKRNSHKSSPMSWIQNEANMNKRGRMGSKATIQNLKPHQSRALTAGTGVKFSTKKKTTKKK